MTTRIPDTTIKNDTMKVQRANDALRHLPLLIEAAKGIVNVYTWRGAKGYTAALKEGVAELQAALKPFALVDVQATEEGNNE